eukprot:TRINITY_DN18194_c0_g1_i2.p1 TRINITY_DN18194_c0_g1~~TRINITY_DN18194_c0_g1_i2.p1  ORF type:complete len:720 (+),score=145.81 TRINITY_DN18194_c0_g1_i2:130-2289(+)
MASSLEQAGRKAVSDRAPIIRTLSEKTPLVDNTSKLGKRLELLEEQLLLNSQQGAKMQTSFDHILGILKQLGNKMQAFESQTRNAVANTDNKFQDVQQQIKELGQTAMDTKRSQDQAAGQYTEIKGQLARASTFQQMLQISGQLSDQVNSSEIRIGKQFQEQMLDISRLLDAKLQAVLDSQSVLIGNVTQLGLDAKSRRFVDDRQHADVCQSLTKLSTDQEKAFLEAKTVTEACFEMVKQGNGKTAKKINENTSFVCGEIASIQKALHVPYSSFKTSKARLNEQQTQGKLNAPDDSDDETTEPKKIRDFFVQTTAASSKEHGMQTEPVKFEDSHPKERKKKKKNGLDTEDDAAEQAAKKKQTAFGNADKLRAQATAAAMKKPYNVFDFYWETGVAQRIAKDPKFDRLTMFLVAVNSIYISVDLDLNHEDLLMNAHPVFIIFENFFCLYFATEILIRFSAFQNKLKAFQDAWFLFDFCLVNVMVIETWLLPIIIAAAGPTTGLPSGFLSILRMLRLGRLLRLTRLTRLARSIPELSIIMKGLSFASRSVVMFFVLWMVIIYIFAIVFSQLTSGDINKRLFPTVPESINTLLLHGVFGSQAEVMRQISDSNPVVLWPIIVFFMALVSVTIMYMLIGVMNECIAVVAATEKSKIEVSYIVGNLREEVERLGYKEEDMHMSQNDMQTLVLEPGIIKVMQEAEIGRATRLNSSHRPLSRMPSSA